MDGTQAASQVREKLGLPIVFLTAYTDQATLDKAKTAEPFAYLKKPVRVEDLKISLELSIYRAEMQRELRESELRFRTVANYTYDWETWILPDGNWFYVSPSCERVTGHSAGRFTGNPDFFYTIVHPDDRSRMKEEFAVHLASEKDDGFFEFRIVQAEGKERWIATEFGFKAHFTDTSFQQAQNDVLSGKADVLTSFFYSKQRDQLFDFTPTLFDVPASIFIDAQRPDIKEMTDLNGKIKKVGQPLYIGQNCMGFKEPGGMLLEIMNAGIEMARRKGVLDQIQTKWLGVTYLQTPSRAQELFPYLLFLLGAVLLVSLFVWIWNVKLRQKVAARTADLTRSEKTLRTILEASPLGIGLTEDGSLNGTTPP